MAQDLKNTLLEALENGGIVYEQSIESLLISGNKLTCILKEKQTDSSTKAKIESILREKSPFMEISMMHSQPQAQSETSKPNAEGIHPEAGIDSIKHVVAVASGKGGVGKSTVSVNLAIAFAAQGKKVGLLDADIYGPSIPIMLDSHDRPSSPDGKTIVPVSAHGLKTLSIGYMLENQDAVVWRGPMLHSALQQMLLHVLWKELDILIIDMPPGTGDVAITISQKARLDGALIVTTPQNVALADARKAIGMFGKVNVPVLGMVENMSYFSCPSCGEETHIFGCDGGKDHAKNNDIPLLGQLPLKAEACTIADKGIPLAGKEALLENEFDTIARALWQRLSEKT